MRVWVVYTRTRIPDGYRILPNNIPTGRKIIPYPPLYRVIPVGYSGFGYPLPSLPTPLKWGKYFKFDQGKKIKVNSKCRCHNQCWTVNGARRKQEKTRSWGIFYACSSSRQTVHTYIFLCNIRLYYVSTFSSCAISWCPYLNFDSGVYSMLNYVNYSLRTRKGCRFRQGLGQTLGI
jgi:hypothetical protein